jgi:ketosteroid isomerase-like protein
MRVPHTLEPLAVEFFAALDAKDFDQLLAVTADGVQSVDEISRGWLRGRRALEGYLRKIGDEVSNIKSSLHDIHTSELGAVGIITFVLEQDYDLGGKAVHIQAPTTIVARRESEGWRVVLFHSVPIPAEG